MASTQQLFVGLGNPGPKYEHNRHNAGFMVLDAMAGANHAPTWQKKFRGLLTEISIESKKIFLLKPQTYMNKSGLSVAEACRFYKIPPEAVTVFHDELDLPPGKIRIKQGGGHGGHNGLRDIDAHFGKNYRRVRLGIGHPGHKDAVSGYVLHDFAKTEREQLDTLIQTLTHNLPLLAAGEDTQLMNLLAK